MAEYIERNKAVDAIAHLMATGFVEDRFITPHELQLLQDELETLPAADVAPVVHGRWRWVCELGFNDCYICSECGKIAMNDSNYFPNCGAKMDKETTDGD